MGSNPTIHAGGGRDHGDDDTVDQGVGQSLIDTHGTDDLLDEIDGLLESNAEEFVRSYVQKGGQ
ncbi:ubiquitin-like protein Pup [Corynebacterium pygosceleis]|uniref:Prokaryotic ubiquitin-like protein Pup n=1 Tax=Corynebacterium pygosceleis TaxID=2800406 RepID=A0A9Q4GKX5_9CORY|nr:ubiquitin-like protein Pup [Corynebacterium pygosceleis]MCK7637057.1 ubiquitin-like protein Pup [Corynebacterium pygosceleis]MCK7674532.1 ubiquitin-like protein Pup [Corynebacterium pygosceleis]MCL0120171.1 ubiquitin-like protein Pup [Corynebacterium pygosceleis]MCX7443715.1 ubiquitin-like protein Pup [Corynebacterium pygosceleis]MCX7467810.1 ubiquitin-like protein Pup [Corynebacterium pygosceleis]